MTLRTYDRLIAIVGRPNVGKSTLFNRIIKKRKSLVYNEPGVTRDRLLEKAEYNGIKFYLCDTGGFEPTSQDNIKKQLVHQAEFAIEEAFAIIFVVDAKEGLHPIDQDLIRRLRKAERKFYVCVNKCDTPNHDYLAEEFRKLGVDAIYPVSAEHGRGIDNLLEIVLNPFINLKPQRIENEQTIKFAIVGRPNVGKSSILNKLIGQKRCIVDDKPGTTRDTVEINIRYFNHDICILDTAGIRRKSKMTNRIEQFSVVRSLSSIEDAHITALVIDALEGPTEGDIRVAGYAFELRKSIIIVVNKWDLINDKDHKTADAYIKNLRINLKYIPYAPIIFVSALENLRISKILETCLDLYKLGTKKIATSQINKTLQEALLKHTPPLRKNRSRRIKFLYATQVDILPPRFVIFCSEPDEIHFSYKRYIENEFRNIFEFTNIPIAIHFKERQRSTLSNLKMEAKAKHKNIDKLDLLETNFKEYEESANNIIFDDE